MVEEEEEKGERDRERKGRGSLREKVIGSLGVSNDEDDEEDDSGLTMKKRVHTTKPGRKPAEDTGTDAGIKGPSSGAIRDGNTTTSKNSSARPIRAGKARRKQKMPPRSKTPTVQRRSKTKQSGLMQTKETQPKSKLTYSLPNSRHGSRISSRSTTPQAQKRSAGHGKTGTSETKGGTGRSKATNGKGQGKTLLGSKSSVNPTRTSIQRKAERQSAFLERVVEGSRNRSSGRFFFLSIGSVLTGIILI